MNDLNYVQIQINSNCYQELYYKYHNVCIKLMYFRTTQLSETEAMLKYLRFVRTMQTKPEFPHWGYMPISTKAAERALQIVQCVVKSTDKPKNHGRQLQCT